MIARRTRAQKLREMQSSWGDLPGSAGSIDPRVRRYIQQAVSPFTRFSPDDFYVDNSGRLASGESESSISIQDLRRQRM